MSLLVLPPISLLANFHSSQNHFIAASQKSELKSCAVVSSAQSPHRLGSAGRLAAVGRLTLLATARPERRQVVRDGQGGQVVPPPPSIQLPGGVFGSSGGTMGRHCSAVVKGHMLRMGGREGAPAYNSGTTSSCLSEQHASGPKVFGNATGESFQVD